MEKGEFVRRQLAKVVTALAVLTLAFSASSATALAAGETDQRSVLEAVADASSKASSTGYVVKATDSARKSWVRTFGATGAALGSEAPSYDLAWVTYDDDTSPSVIIAGKQRDIQVLPVTAGWVRVDHWKETSGLSPALLKKVDGFVASEGGDDSSYLTMKRTLTSDVLYADTGVLVKMIIDWATSPVTRTESPASGTETYSFDGSAGVGDVFSATVEVRDGLVRKISLVNKPYTDETYLAQTVEAIAYGSDVIAPDVEAMGTIEGLWITRLTKWASFRAVSLSMAESIARNARAIAAVDTDMPLMRAVRIAAREQFDSGPGLLEYIVTWGAKGVTMSVKGSERLNDFGPSCARVSVVRGKIVAKACPEVKPI